MNRVVPRRQRWAAFALPGLLAIGLGGPLFGPFFGPLSGTQSVPWAGNPPWALEARELSAPLREATERLRAGEFAAARQLAESVHRMYPREIEPLLLIGEIEIAAGRPAEAKPWFAQAAKLNRHHPLVAMYQQVFKEIEHRRGPFPGQAKPGPSPADDKTETANRFKRGWFGTGATQSFPKVAIATSSVKPTMASFTHGIFLARTLEEYAREAVQNRRFLQAYLYFTELMDRHPQNDAYRIGKAETALEMGRGREARGLLLPLYVKNPGDPLIKDLLLRCTDLKALRELDSLRSTPAKPPRSEPLFDRPEVPSAVSTSDLPTPPLPPVLSKP